MADQPIPNPKGSGSAAEEKPINPKLLIPKTDGTLAEVARLVSATWATETWLTLRWKTRADFATLATNFSATVTEKRSDAATRTPQTQRLQELDDEMDEGLRILKKYIEEENGYSKSKAKAQLPAFGLAGSSRGGLRLTQDRDQRRDALRDFLLPAVAAAGFAGRDYGTAFWQPRYEEYRTLLAETDGLAGRVTQGVSKKDASKKELRRALQAIIYALRANYPDTYAAELRAWGFRKVSY